MPEFIMLVGLPGSGKSTYIEKLLEKYPERDYVIISSDDIIEEVALKEGKTYSEVFEKTVGYATAEMKRRAKAAAADGRNIIWDQTNMTVKSRTSKMKDFAGYNFSAVVFSLTDEELNRRLKKRESETGKVIPGFIIKNMANSYVAPSKSEGFENIQYIRN